MSIYLARSKLAISRASMDSSMVESVFDDEENSDYLSPAPAAVCTLLGAPSVRNSRIVMLSFCLLKAKPKTKAAAPKAAPKKAPAAPKAAPKKPSQTTLKPKAKPIAPKKRAKPDTEDEDIDPQGPPVNDDSLLSATPPSAKKQKKAQAPQKTAGKPLQELENEAMGYDGAGDPKPKKGSKSTETYQKVSCKNEAILVTVLMLSVAHPARAHS